MYPLEVLLLPIGTISKAAKHECPEGKYPGCLYKYVQKNVCQLTHPGKRAFCIALILFGFN